MNWNDHSKLEGKHSILSPSSPSWLNYSDESSDALYQRYISQYSQTLGTALHQFACERIRNRLKINAHEKNSLLAYLIKEGIPRDVIDMSYIYDNLMHYINDGIGFGLDPEVMLYFSPNCFGTADTINFKKDFLRIHDYKSGRTPVHMEQLEVYAALFCFEYKVKPSDISMELRIYQTDNLAIENPESSTIEAIMDKIVKEDKQLSYWRGEGYIL